MSISSTYADIISRIGGEYDSQLAAVDRENTYRNEQARGDKLKTKTSNWVGYRQAQDYMPQTLQAMGYSGGPAESTMRGMNVDYENNNIQADKTYADLLKEYAMQYDSQRSRLRLAKSNALSQYQALLAQAQEQDARASNTRGRKKSKSKRKGEDGGEIVPASPDWTTGGGDGYLGEKFDRDRWIRNGVMDFEPKRYVFG
ncbi:MAG: hypothetical protein RSA97_02985 [Oscillospiraceae bacterium]